MSCHVLLAFQVKRASAHMVPLFDIAEAAAHGLFDVGECYESSHFKRLHVASFQMLVGMVATGLGISLHRPEGRTVCMSWIEHFIGNRSKPGFDVGNMFHAPADKRVARNVWRAFEYDILDPMEGARRLLALSKPRTALKHALR
jgi:hypothetical protein